MKESPFAKSIMELRYSWEKDDGSKESWQDISYRVATNVFSAVEFSGKESIVKEIIDIISNRKFIPGGRFLAQSGRKYHQTNNCFLLRAEDSREGWGDLLNKATIMLMSGGGIGVDYSDLRPAGSPLKRSGGFSSGPIPLMKTINEVGRGVMAGGKRRSAIWAGLRWNHKDIESFITLKNWIPEVRKLKEKDFDFPAAMDMTNISIILDKDFFDAYDNIDHPNNAIANNIYWMAIDRMLKTGEPGFGVDYNNSHESLRNACTEIVSEDDSDVCCLGSINLSEINNLEELKRVTYLGQLFLIVGTEYSDTPTDKIKAIRNKNRRTGLGLMGIHEWLIKKNYKYEKNDELSNWLETWKNESNASAKYWSNKLSFKEPIAKRAIAPNGSISIAGGMTTSGLEPLFSVAYQRRYLTPDGWKKQYVVDFIAEKLYEEGINPNTIEDAYTLSQDVKRRIDFQAFVQTYIDNSISSTINLPSFGSEGNNNPEEFGNILMQYLPKLRGITVYPNGARGGQPLTPVDFEFAYNKKGVVFEGNEECENGVCGL
jgi:ribonucleoside-diphosphate reductase alpha chain